MSFCKSCNARMNWFKTSAGKSIPIDAEPCNDGNLVVIDGVALTYDAFAHTGLRRYKSHFATCPHAASHRKKPSI